MRWGDKWCVRVISYPTLLVPSPTPCPALPFPTQPYPLFAFLPTLSYSSIPYPILPTLPDLTQPYLTPTLLHSRDSESWEFDPQPKSGPPAIFPDFSKPLALYRVQIARKTTELASKNRNPVSDSRYGAN